MFEHNDILYIINEKKNMVFFFGFVFKAMADSNRVGLIIKRYKTNKQKLFKIILSFPMTLVHFFFLRIV